LQKTKSGDLGSLAGKHQRLIAIKKAARWNKPLLENLLENHRGQPSSKADSTIT
jgi:hypothetical protein